MAGNTEQKSRKERRKEARSEKGKLRFLSWVQHQSGKKKKPTMPVVEQSLIEEKKPKKDPAVMKEKKKRKREPEGKRKPKSNFQEYLEMEMGGAVSRDEDLETERRLAKKLKVKKGKLGGPDDGMDELFADLGFGGEFGSDDETKSFDWNVADDNKLNKKKKKKKVKKDDMEMEEPDDEGVDMGKKNAGKRKKKKVKKDETETEEPDDGGVGMDEENDGAVLESEDGDPIVVELPTESKGKYVPPSLRAASNSESEEIAQIRRRVRGLLNKLSESNVESITQEIATLFRVWPEATQSLASFEY